MTKIKEINQHIREGINQWADIMLTADADEWAEQLCYFPRDLMNAIFIFQHIASNIGIKAGHIDEELLTEWKRLLKADDWYISVKWNQLHVTFKVRYKKEGKQ